CRPHRTLHSFPTRRSSDLTPKTYVAGFVVGIFPFEIIMASEPFLFHMRKHSIGSCSFIRFRKLHNFFCVIIWYFLMKAITDMRRTTVRVTEEVVDDAIVYLLLID